jgi:hypothetical protein
VPSWRDSAKSRITLKSAELCDVALDAVPNRPRKLVGRATTGLRGHESSWAIASVRFDPPGLLQHVKDVILFDVLQRCRGGRAVTIARNVLFLALGVAGNRQQVVSELKDSSEAENNSALDDVLQFAEDMRRKRLLGRSPERRCRLSISAIDDWNR